MSHTCSNALIRCMDFRLEPAIADYMKAHNLASDTDIISVAGAAKDINDQAFGDIVRGQLGLSKKLHDIQTIILMNHTDCGGYGGRSAFDSREAEWDHHVTQLNAASETLQAEFEGITVKKLIADIQDDGSVEIKEV